MTAASEQGVPEYMTRAEVQAAFQVHPYTVTRWADTGKLTTIRTPGGQRRYLASEVRALLAGDAPRWMQDEQHRGENGNG
jgi:predicted site-specific integrase-resolvase